jgi:hypothetical protein
MVSEQRSIGVSRDELFDILIQLTENDAQYTVKVAEEGEEPDITMFPRDAPGYHQLEVELFYDEDYDPEWIRFLKEHAHDIEV